MSLLRSLLVLLVGLACTLCSAASAQPLVADAVGAPSAPLAVDRAEAGAAASTPELPRVSPQYELQLLRNHRPRLGWPIAVTAGGGGLLVGSVAMVGLAYLWSGVGGPALGYDDSEPNHVREMRPLLISAGIGAALAGAGVVWMLHRLRERKPYNQRIRELTTTRAPNALVSW
jgi:hypothetical protein